MARHGSHLRRRAVMRADDLLAYLRYGRNVAATDRYSCGRDQKLGSMPQPHKAARLRGLVEQDSNLRAEPARLQRVAFDRFRRGGGQCNEVGLLDLVLGVLGPRGRRRRALTTGGMNAPSRANR